MSAEIIPFDFEEQAVRVLMRGEDPWFVAADVCRVLEIGNSRDAVSRLDDDERDTINLNTVGNTDGIRGNPNATIINESGLYALVLTSRKEQARRFRKWITAEVLPAIRKHGRYEHRLPEPDTTDIAGMPIREAELWLSMVREARLTRGTRAAATIWDRSPLPPLAHLPANRATVSPAEGRACLDHLLAQAGDAIALARDHSSELGERALTDLGLRCRPEGLFVANHPLALFLGTPWAAGAHRTALAALAGVFPLPTTLTLNRVSTRGLILPWALVDGGDDA